MKWLKNIFQDSSIIFILYKIEQAFNACSICSFIMLRNSMLNIYLCSAIKKSATVPGPECEPIVGHT